MIFRLTLSVISIFVYVAIFIILFIMCIVSLYVRQELYRVELITIQWATLVGKVVMYCVYEAVFILLLL